MHTHHRISALLAALSGAFAVALTANAMGAEVKYDPGDNVKFTYCYSHPPAIKIKPGDTVITSTRDASNDVFAPTDKTLMNKLDLTKVNPQTGPFYIDGAEPGDTVVIRINKLEPARDHGISSFFPGFGALNGTDRTAVLGEELPEKVWFYDVDRAKGVARTKSLDGKSSWEVPLAPFLGCLGVSPGQEVRSTIVPDFFGGNMDCPEVRAGNTVSLGVNVPGALLSFGDGHYVMGDGEIIGTPYCWATRPPASESEDATSPSTATTLSSVIRRVTAVPASCDFPWSS